MVSVLEGIHIMQRHHKNDVYVKICYVSKLYLTQKKFNFFIWIWHLFRLMKKKNVYFIRDFATHDTNIFTSFDEIIIITKNWISSIYYLTWVSEKLRL